jgi:hypothetical protein
MMLLMAAALAAATPVVQSTPLPVTDEEVQLHATACAGLITGRLSPGQVVQGLQLDTPEKFRTFVLTCKSFKLGFELGSSSASRPTT